MLFWKQPSPGQLFVSASESTHYKFLRAEFWQHDENQWVYFMYLNLPVVLALFKGGIYMLFVDLLFVFFVSISL